MGEKQVMKYCQNVEVKKPYCIRSFEWIYATYDSLNNPCLNIGTRLLEFLRQRR